jgi:uncharacterized membrane protein (UPF0127 family)
VGDRLKLLPIAIVAAAAIMVAVVYYMLTDDVTGHDEATVDFELADGGSLKITCEVADNALERATGLQNREKMAIDKGMLFVFEEPKEASFIMRNVEFPLDIIFIAKNGTVMNVEEAEVEEPGTPDGDLIRYRSNGEVKWVVEINRGISQQNGIGPGTQVEVVFND